MDARTIVLAGIAALAAVPLARSTGYSQGPLYFGRICRYPLGEHSVPASWEKQPPLPVASCPPAPTGYTTLPSIGTGGNTSANLAIGYDPDTKRLCFVATALPLAPVLRVGVGDALSINIANTLHDTGGLHNKNCDIETYGGEGLCEPTPVFPELPGPDGSFYPIMANEAHMADGTANLHVHGLFVSPRPCSDEVLQSTIYPANWRDKIGTLPPCQANPDNFTYTYQLPSNHPAGAYWYHTHRHGQAEHETQMGLYGAIVVEDEGDAWRASLGVTDEVLVVGDVPNPACVQGPNCDVLINGGHTRRQPNAAAARAAAWAQAETGDSATGDARAPVKLDPRIDQVDQAGECAYGASGDEGGVELWTLLLNGAPVPESQDGFPPDNELLNKTMQPGQRQIFRLVNVSANSWVAPELVLNQGGVLTTLPLEVFARDGVGIADAKGRRRFRNFDVAKNQLLVPPSGRVEFVVHAPPPGAELYLQSSQVAPGCGGNAYPARRLLLITPAGAPVNPGDPNDHDLLEHTPSLEPYLSTLGADATVHRTFVLSEYSRAFTYAQTTWPKQVPTTADYDPLQTDFFITQVAADDGEVHRDKTAVKPFTGHNLAPQVVVHLHGRQSVTEDWLVENSTLEIHAFHIHQIHFRVLSDDRNDPTLQPLLDTVTIPAAPLIGDPATGYPGAPGYVRLRMTFTTADIGEFVFHCHILEHEDNGMMGKIKVVAD
jgi:FtsP/CotA-like multicopper oxidase with cupredoxin domain